MEDRNIMTFKSNPALTGFARLIPNVKYSQKYDQHMAIMAPWAAPGGNTRPLVVFVQGSAWTFPNVNHEIPQLSELAQQGYVVATIEHRNAVEGNPWPAYLEDTKCAIRYLRAHADEYGIDKDRVCIYGTSSGGNTALLVALTGDDPRFKTDEYADQSDSVQLMVECFGPTDLPNMIDRDPDKASEGNKALIYGLAGERTPEETIRLMSPVNYLEKDKEYPPFMLLYGDADTVVPYEQGVEMYGKLKDIGADVRFVRVKGAGHEGDFWSRPLVDAIYSFIREKL